MKQEKLDYFTLRLGWLERRILGDIMPDHPRFGAIPTGDAWVSLVLSAIYESVITDSINSVSALKAMFMS